MTPWRTSVCGLCRRGGSEMGKRRRRCAENDYLHALAREIDARHACYAETQQAVRRLLRRAIRRCAKILDDGTETTDATANGGA